jgi:hypothetical protein
MSDRQGVQEKDMRRRSLSNIAAPGCATFISEFSFQH